MVNLSYMYLDVSMFFLTDFTIALVLTNGARKAPDVGFVDRTLAGTTAGL